MSAPCVSIVVPTFNSADFLPRMIDSVLRQTCIDWELILVDGGVDSETLDVVESYRERLAGRFLFIREPNRGCCAARNRGIESSRGRYIAFLDSDDEFLPRKLERQLELFRIAPEIDLTFCDFAYIDERGGRHPSAFATHAPKVLAIPYCEMAPNLRVCSTDLFDYLIEQYLIATIVGMVKREALQQGVRFLESQWHSLAEWVFYLDIADTHRVGYVNEPLCLHHVRNGSITRQSRLRNHVAHRDLLQLMADRFGQRSAHARLAIRRQLADANRQLGYLHFAEGHYADASRSFADELCQLRSVRAAFDLMHSGLKCVTARRDSTPLSAATSIG